VFDFEVTVTKRDGSAGTYALTFDALCEFEETAKVGVPVAFNESNIKLGHLALLGWIAEKNSGATVKPLPAWRKDIASINVEDRSPPTSEVE
jgi:hypothetical protein